MTLPLRWPFPPTSRLVLFFFASPAPLRFQSSRPSIMRPSLTSPRCWRIPDSSTPWPFTSRASGA